MSVQKIRFDIWVIVGTRPELIKQVPLYRMLLNKFGKTSVGLIGTGQHRELLEQALTHFGEKLDVNLDLMQSGMRLGETSALIHKKIEEIIFESRPKLIIVQGDTTTAAMTAIAGFHNKVKIVHNEAGLRTYDNMNPYPEEANRRWIGNVADYHFPPTELAKEALLREGVDPSRIWVVGNTGIDAMMWTIKEKPCPADAQNMINSCNELGLKPVIVTAHRRENDATKMDSWFKSLSDFVNERKDIMLICPMHPNNRAMPSAQKYLGSNDRVWIGPPLDYGSLCHMLKECRFIVTDSGGIQEEAATMAIPTVVCRKVTERMEAVHAGIAKLAEPTDGAEILKAMKWAYEHFNKPVKERIKIQHPFGSGDASVKIADILAKFV
jgi:UDP-N-acetylglucosamine 2-epimerase (non-hydrolysing)